MKIRSWDASPAARKHMLEKHDVEWDEVDEVLSTAPQVFRGRNNAGERRYQVVGRTASGRELKVVFSNDGGILRVITAFEEGR